MLTPLVQFPTITCKIATDSGSKTAFHFWWKMSVEHGPAMLVLFSNSAIKYIYGRNRLSKNAVAPLESIREPSSDGEGEVMQR